MIATCTVVKTGRTNVQESCTGRTLMDTTIVIIIDYFTT